MPDALPAFEAGSISNVRLVDQVVAELSAAILDGRLPDALPGEARLAGSFGVSKQVVREALRQLSALGIVQTGQGRATRVRILDAEPLGRFWQFAAGNTAAGLAEAVELRRMLEPQVARLAAQRHDPAGMERLHTILGRMEAAIGNVGGWIEADLDFHDQIGRLSGNRLVRLQVHGLRPVIQQVMLRFNARANRSGADLRETWYRHARVVAALERRDPDEAAAAMLAHFAAAEDAIAELFPRA